MQAHASSLEGGKEKTGKEEKQSDDGGCSHMARTPTATGAWKRPGMDSLLEPPEEAQPASTLIPTSARPHPRELEDYIYL